MHGDLELMRLHVEAEFTHDAGVETPPALRGRGYAAAAVATWAAAVRAAGAEPLYSTWWQNAASRSLARKLGLAVVGRDLHVT